MKNKIFITRSSDDLSRGTFYTLDAKGNMESYVKGELYWARAAKTSKGDYAMYRSDAGERCEIYIYAQAKALLPQSFIEEIA